MAAGFCDSHLHLISYGARLFRIEMEGVKSIDELIEKGRAELGRLAHIQNDDGASLLYGSGWNQNEFDALPEGERRFPNRFDLDKIISTRPLFLTRVCGHIGSCNTKALSLLPRALQSDETADGILHGAALAAMRKMVPPPDKTQIKKQLEFALRHAMENEIDAVISQDVFDGNYVPVVEAYRELLADIPVSVTLQGSYINDEKLKELAEKKWVSGENISGGEKHNRLKMGAVKLYADGSLGSHTALLRTPYSDAPGTCGIEATPPEKLIRIARTAHNLGFQVFIHAIGDKGVDNAIAALAPLCKNENAGNKLRRHGIIHAEIAWPEQLERIAEAGLLVLAQPAFLTHDIYFAEARLGAERARRLLPLKSIADLGICAAYGSDCPVESLNPRAGIEAAVKRQDVYNKFPAGGFVPEEAVDEAAAAEAFTTAGHFASFV